MYKVNDIDHTNAKVDALTKKIKSLTVTLATTVAIVTSNCELYGTPGHNTPKCHLLAGIPSDQVNYAQETHTPIPITLARETIQISPIRTITRCLLQTQHLLFLQVIKKEPPLILKHLKSQTSN